MVYAGPAFSCRNHRGGPPICGGRVNPSQDEGFLWGLRSYLAAFTPPAQLLPG